MIYLDWPWMLAALPLPYVVYRFVPHARRQEAALRVPFFPALQRFEGALLSATTRTRMRHVIAIMAWVALVAASAKPEWGGDPIQLPVSGRDLMVAVDISGSMQTEDMVIEGRRATRLAAVKEVVGDFVARRTGDRLGLILFGDRPYLQTPLTFDRPTVQMLLEEAQIGIAGTRTAIGYAIGLAVKHLWEQAETSRVLILLTDGVNTVGDITPLQAARLAAQERIRIHTIGFGAESMIDRRRLFPRRINPSQDLDEETLQEVARLTGGRYFRARGVEELAGVYAELDQLEPVEQDAETFRPIRSLYYWPLGVAFILTLLLATLNRMIYSVLDSSARRVRDLFTRPSVTDRLAEGSD